MEFEIEALRELIGPNSDDILWWQMVVRAAIVFVFAVVLFRLSSSRVFGKNTAFDIVLGVILGSILSRAITGNSPMLPTLAASIALILLHLLFARIAVFWPWFGHSIKGRAVCLVKDGRREEKAMRAANITERDLMEAVRERGGVSDLSRVEEAYLERSGEISVITRGDGEKSSEEQSHRGRSRSR